MNTLTRWFLKARHWQLFLLMCGLPLFLQLVIVGLMLGQIFGNEQPDPAFLFGYFRLFPVIMILFMGVFFGWVWSIAIGLQNKIPPELRMNTSTFRVLFFIPLVYIILFSLAIGVLMTGFTTMFEDGSSSSIGLVGIFVATVVPIHLFSIVCIFYCMYFVSKTFKTVELQRRTTFTDFSGEFFLIWFYPVGVWILQPKINKMMEGEPVQLSNI